VCQISRVFHGIYFDSVYLYISEVFYDGKAKKYIEGRLIKSFAVFKKGINPTWEDPANANGSELVASSAFLPDIFDAFWENLVLGLIGESIDDADQICGCRVVDQTRKNNAKPTYKIELWLRTTEDTICSRIKTRLSHTLLDGDKNFSKVKLPDFDLNRHKA
jgi:translation initiation factor 4E